MDITATEIDEKKAADKRTACNEIIVIIVMRMISESKVFQENDYGMIVLLMMKRPVSRPQKSKDSFRT